MPSDLVDRVRRWFPVFSLALVIRVGYWILVTPRWRPDADADQYVRLARSMAAGDGFGLIFPQMVHHPTAFRPPLYPLLLTPGAWLFEGALWPHRLVNVVLGCVVAVLAGVLAARIGGRRAGLVAGALVAVYPPLVFNDTVTLTEPLGLLLVLAAVLLVDDRRWAAAGFATGLLLLTRPNGYLVVAVLAFWVWRRMGARRAVGLVAVAALVLAPWLVRNRIQVGTWRTTTSDGLTLAAVYGPQAQRAGHFVDPVFAVEYQEPRYRFAQFDEPGWSRLLQDDAAKALRDDPGYVLHVLAGNTLGFFELDPARNAWAEGKDGRRWGVRQATLPAFYLVTVAGLAGVVLHRRHRLMWPMVLLTAQFVALSLLLVAPPRLRAPFDLLCCIGVGLLVTSERARQ